MENSHISVITVTYIDVRSVPTRVDSQRIDQRVSKKLFATLLEDIY